MAQPKRNLASALAHLYLSRGGSESDLNDVMDSADIVAMLYHQLGGNEATPKGMPMAELVALLSNTQGGGGGASGDINITWTFENSVNDAEIMSSALPISLKTYFDAERYQAKYLVGAYVEMEEDSDPSSQYTFVVENEIGTVKTMTASYDSARGVYCAAGDATDLFEKGNNTRKIVFEKVVK